MNARSFETIYVSKRFFKKKWPLSGGHFFVLLGRIARVPSDMDEGELELRHEALRKE
ncbi:hypothetical protein [Paraburkholderia sp. BR14320]|uniref:hypothetical protein n=1 Tax=unclassified Paraburkholderia TaxID=2615204 RepID=UPI0034CD1B90